MEFKAKNIADFLGGTVEGDINVTVSGVAKIEEAKPGTLAFLSNPNCSGTWGGKSPSPDFGAVAAGGVRGGETGPPAGRAKRNRR